MPDRKTELMRARVPRLLKKAVDDFSASRMKSSSSVMRDAMLNYFKTEAPEIYNELIDEAKEAKKARKAKNDE